MQRTLKMLHCLALVAFVAAFFTQRADAQQRIALVIGNSNYVALNKLPNAENDARAVATALTQLGFAVTLEQNQTLASMSASISRFIDQLRQNPSAAAVFYYAGHGLESGGVNYLVPIEAKITSAQDVPRDTVDLTRFIERFGG